MIPKIIRDYFSPHKNILLKIFRESCFTNYKNKFKLISIKIGPFTNKNSLNFIIENFKKKVLFNSQSEFDNINFKYYLKEKHKDKRILNYTILEFNSDFIVDNAVNIKIHSKSVHFNCWINFFYITLERYFCCVNEIYGLNLIQQYNNSNNDYLSKLSKSFKSFKENDSTLDNNKK